MTEYQNHSSNEERDFQAPKQEQLGAVNESVELNKENPELPLDITGETMSHPESLGFLETTEVLATATLAGIGKAETEQARLAIVRRPYQATPDSPEITAIVVVGLQYDTDAKQFRPAGTIGLLSESAEVTIGRTSEMQTLWPGSNFEDMSRSHLTVRREAGDKLVFTDNNSLNGTHVEVPSATPEAATPRVVASELLGKQAVEQGPLQSDLREAVRQPELSAYEKEGQETRAALGDLLAIAATTSEDNPNRGWALTQFAESIALRTKAGETAISQEVAPFMSAGVLMGALEPAELTDALFQARNLLDSGAESSNVNGDAYALIENFAGRLQQDEYDREYTMIQTLATDNLKDDLMQAGVSEAKSTAFVGGLEAAFGARMQGHSADYRSDYQMVRAKGENRVAAIIQTIEQR